MINVRSGAGGGSSGGSGSSSAIVTTSDTTNPTPAPIPVPVPLLQDPSSPKYVLRSFLNSYALTTIELTATWTKFRPSSLSPFIPPFAKFLTRYPVESVKYFFSAERILDLEVYQISDYSQDFLSIIYFYCVFSRTYFTKIVFLLILFYFTL